jgi:phage-related protein (TIGR01555 family)
VKKKQARNAGRFAPGTSGNPNGRPSAVRTDGVYNSYTGHGTGDDRRSFSRHVTKPMVDEIALDLRRGNWIAKRICEWLPQDAFRKGYTLKLDDKETAEEVCALAEALCLDRRVAELGAMARTCGGGALFPVLDGAVGDLSEPLDLDGPRILAVRAIHLFEPRELSAISYYDDITHPKFRKPNLYRVNAIGYGRATMTVIHESRLAIMYGDRVSSEDLPGQHDGWGDGKLTPVEEIIHDYGLAWGSAATILHNFSERVQAVEGLMKILANRDGASILTANLKRMDMLRSTLRTRITDAAATVTESAKSVAGLSDMLIQMAQLVSGAGDIPMTRLFGMSPAGMNATGEFDLLGIHERVAAEQSGVYTPIVEWLLRLILLSADGPTKGKEPDVWGIEWKPLKQQTETEIATTRKTVAETDVMYVDMGVPPEQILKSRFGGDTYSMETTVDFADLETQMAAREQERKEMAEAMAQQPAPGEDEKPAEDPEDA